MIYPRRILAPVAAFVGVSGWTPSALGSALKLWYDFSLLSGSNGDQQETLTDSSGTGNNATQAVGSKRCTLAAADLNGLNTVRFTAANVQAYALPNVFSGASAGSGYVVLKRVADPSADGSTSGMWNLGTDNSCHWPWTDGNIYENFGSNARKTVGNPSVSMASTYRIYSIYSASNDWAFYIDGGAGGSSGGTSAFFSTGTNTVSFDTTPQLGCDDGGSFFLNGWVAEMFFTNAKQTDAIRQKAEGYLAHKWGLTGELDSSHPYKSSPPPA